MAHECQKTVKERQDRNKLPEARETQTVPEENAVSRRMRGREIFWEIICKTVVATTFVCPSHFPPLFFWFLWRNYSLTTCVLRDLSIVVSQLILPQGWVFHPDHPVHIYHVSSGGPLPEWTHGPSGANEFSLRVVWGRWKTNLLFSPGQFS